MKSEIRQKETNSDGEKKKKWGTGRERRDRRKLERREREMGERERMKEKCNHEKSEIESNHVVSCGRALEGFPI